MRRRYLLLALVGMLVLGSTGLSLALPQQQGSVDLLNQSDGQWQGPGEAQGGSSAGSSVAGLGSIVKGRRGAVAIGAPEANPGGRQGAGSVYIVAGQSGTRPIDLTALSGRGYRIDGASAGDKLGYSVATLRLAGGDPGLAIGAPYAAPGGRQNAGVVYVVDLKRLHQNVDLSSPPRNGAVVSVISGPAACAETGYAVAGAGPAGSRKGDGLLVGAPGAGPHGCPQDTAGGQVGGNSGAAFVIHGPRLPARLDLAAAGGSATAFDGAASGDRAGSAVSAGGIAGSLMIGAPYASPLGRAGAGAVYLLHGARPGATVSLGAPPAGSTTFEGAAADDATGFALGATVGTAAGSRRSAAELVLGAPQGSPYNRTHAGSVFLVPAARQPALVDLARIAKPGGLAGERIDGANPGDEAGWSVAGVGDLNGDGRPDLAVGAPFANSQTGQDRIDNGAAYVVYGGGGPGILDLGALHSSGYVAFGARNSDEAGTAVAGVTNENGDGRPDLLIGAPYAENTTGSTPAVGGAAYVLFGFGGPALRYSPRSETGRVGNRLSPLRPIARATGTPSFSISPKLPRGVDINRSTGRISGTPRVSVRRTVYTVQMSDLAGLAAATVSLTIVR